MLDNSSYYDSIFAVWATAVYRRKEDLISISNKSKDVPKSKFRQTHYSSSFVSQMRNTEVLKSSLSVGSMNRLKQFQNSIMATRGENDTGFDKDLVNLTLQYCWNREACEADLKYLKSLFDEDGYPFSRNLRIYSKTEEAMARFAAPNHQSFRYNRNYQLAKASLIKKLSQNQLNPLVFTCDDDIKHYLPKLSTHSGFTYLLSGKKTKGENIEGSYSTFTEKVNHAIDINQPTFDSYIMIGFRTQASGEFDDDGSRTHTFKHKVRIVSMVDLISIINELQFSNPIQRMLSNENFYAGGKNLRDIGSIISHYRSINQSFVSIDYKSFDQTISAWLIEDAFDVLHHCFSTLSPRQEFMWNIMVNDFINKNFIVGEGLVHSEKGVPSGSMFTQIIDSIVNFLVVTTYFNHLQKCVSMICMGDDNLIFIKMNSDQFSLEDMATYISKRFGLIVDTSDKTNLGTVKQDPIFLKIKWSMSGRWRAPQQLLSRMAYPERARRYDKTITPAHVLLAYILAYPAGMGQLVDIARFRRDYPISAAEVDNVVDGRYVPGVLAYLKEYNFKVA